MAEDGESALDRLKHDQPNLVLLDILLPGIDGFETCRRIEKKPGHERYPRHFY